MNIFGIGLPEMVVIAAIALIVFGPKRLPEMGKTLGRTLKGFQTASQEFEQELRTAMRTAEDDALPQVSSTPPSVSGPPTPLEAGTEDGIQAGVSSAASPPSV